MKQTLTKTDLTEAVMLSCAISKQDANRAVETALKSITHALAQGEEVRIIGFGTFSVRQRPRRKARNPRTGQLVEVPESRQVRFAPGSALRDAVNAE